MEHIWTRQLANGSTGPLSTMNTNSLLIPGHERTYQVLGMLKGEFHGRIYMLFVAQRRQIAQHAWQSA